MKKEVVNFNGFEILLEEKDGKVVITSSKDGKVVNIQTLSVPITNVKEEIENLLNNYNWESSKNLIENNADEVIELFKEIDLDKITDEQYSNVIKFLDDLKKHGEKELLYNLLIHVLDTNNFGGQFTRTGIIIKRFSTECKKANIWSGGQFEKQMSERTHNRISKVEEEQNAKTAKELKAKHPIFNT